MIAFPINAAAASILGASREGAASAAALVVAYAFPQGARPHQIAAWFVERGFDVLPSQARGALEAGEARGLLERCDPLEAAKHAKRRARKAVDA